MTNYTKLFWMSFATFLVFLIEDTYMILAKHVITAICSTLVLAIAMLFSAYFLSKMVDDARK